MMAAVATLEMDVDLAQMDSNLVVMVAEIAWILPLPLLLETLKCF